MGSLMTETPYSEITATMEVLDRLGVSREDLKRFRKSSRRVRLEVAKLMQGMATFDAVIDCDADPFVPDGWKKKEHKKDGQLTFNPSQIELYLDDEQKDSGSVESSKLRQGLANKLVLNANVLDYLIANPDLIPDEWKEDEKTRTRYICFWGTVYSDAAGNLCVRCLCHRGGRWKWGINPLRFRTHDSSPAAVRAS